VGRVSGAASYAGKVHSRRGIGAALGRANQQSGEMPG